jgi:16S rRNA G966 N2-methylase RsmD
MLNDKELVFIKDNLYSDTDKLLLKYHKIKDGDIDYMYCINQIKLRKKFSDKFPFLTKRDDFLFPLSLNLEQSSSEYTAMYKSLLVEKGESVLDLTSGFGIDDIYFSKKASRIVCVEQNKMLVDLLSHNFNSLKAENYLCVNADCQEYLMNVEGFDVIYLDPARRDENKNKVFEIEASQPNVLAMMDSLLSKAKRIILKLSPMVDIKQIEKSFEYISDIHIVSLKNECKEILVVINKSVKQEINYHCVDIKSLSFENDDFFLCFNKLSQRDNKLPQRENQLPQRENLKNQRLLKYLYEPNVSILKLGRFDALIEKYGFEKLHRHSHLFTSENLIENFEGRCFELLEQRNASPKALKDIKQANITVRNFPQTVSEIRNKTKIKEGGEMYLFFTTLKGEEKVCLVCKKINL